MDTSFMVKLKEAMAVRNITATELSKLSGISKPRISQYLNGIYTPKSRAIIAISTALNINSKWLMGYDVPMEPMPFQVDFSGIESIRIACKRNFNEGDDEIAENIIHKMTLLSTEGLRKMEERADELKLIPQYSNTDESKQ